MSSLTFDDPQMGGLRRGLLLKRCLRWTGGNLSEAEDLLGDAWLRLLENGESGRPHPVDLRSFLLTIINNLGRDRLRRAQRWKHGDSEDYDSLQALTSSAEHLVFLRECLTAAVRELERASEKARTALLLRSSGLEYSRIAVLLSTSEPNARKLVETVRGSLLDAHGSRLNRRSPGSTSSKRAAAQRRSAEVAAHGASAQS